MAIDIQLLTQRLNSATTPNYSQAGMILAMLGNALQDLYVENASVRVLQWDPGGGDQQQSLNSIRDQMTRLLNQASDTSSHAPDDTYDSWDAAKQLWIKLAIEANTIGAGETTTIDNLSSIPDYIAQAAEDAPGTIGKALGSVGNAVGSGAGSLLGGFLSSAGLPLLIVVGLVVLIAVKEG